MPEVAAAGEGIELANDEVRQRGAGLGQFFDEGWSVLGDDAGQVGLRGLARLVGRVCGTLGHGPRDAGRMTTASADLVSAS
jgi:hypothetical protein